VKGNRGKSAALAVAILALSGCADLAYYYQAAAGHWQVLRLRRPLASVLADPATPADLARRLATARRLRDFASAELALPDNGSYRRYADLGRPYVVHNVFAAPELSLALREWCFPVLGGVAYRGYFDVAAAEQLAQQLRTTGYDVFVADIPAYSTLGWFDDPLLNTFINWPVGRVAELVFHELAHQRLYIGDDTTFNESFATAVGQLGARLWLEQQGAPQERDDYAAYTRQQEAFMALTQSTREQLTRLYASAQDDAAKRREKQRLLAELRTRYDALKQEQLGGDNGYDLWFTNDLNNAKLGALNTYTRLAPAFEALFEREGRDFAAFYAAAKRISRRPPPERERYLAGLMNAMPEQALAATPAAGATHRQAPQPARLGGDFAADPHFR